MIFIAKKIENLFIYPLYINRYIYTQLKMTILNTLKPNITNIVTNVEIDHKYGYMINELRLTRLSIMNSHENFCHVASIFRKDGKAPCFKLCNWL
jgi:hypothetical protein